MTSGSYQHTLGHYDSLNRDDFIASLTLSVYITNILALMTSESITAKHRAIASNYGS